MPGSWDINCSKQINFCLPVLSQSCHRDHCTLAAKGSGILIIKGRHYGRSLAHVITAKTGQSLRLKPFGNVFNDYPEKEEAEGEEEAHSLNHYIVNAIHTQVTILLPKKELPSKSRTDISDPPSRDQEGRRFFVLVEFTCTSLWSWKFDALNYLL